MSKIDSNKITNTLIEIFKEILSFMDEKILELTKKEFLEEAKCNFCIDYDLLENDYKFYQMVSILYNDILNPSYYDGNIEEICKNKLLKKLLPIYINYLIRILTNYKEAYKDYILKLNLIIFFDYLKNQTGKELILSIDYFFWNINELEAIYHDEQTLNQVSEVIKNEYYEYKYFMLKHISKSEIPKLFQNIPKIIDMNQSLRNDIIDKKINITNFNEYLKKYNSYIQIYLDSIGKNLGIQNSSKCENIEINDNTDTDGIKKVNIKRYLFELEDLKEIVAFIANFPIHPIPSDALIYFIENNFKAVNDLREIISEIISSEEFYNKLRIILKSNVIKNYFNSPRKFNNTLYGTEPCSVEESDINLRKAYEEFVQKYEKGGKEWIKNLIIYKDLPKGKRAFVNEIPKIFLNTLFIQVINEPINVKKNPKYYEDFKKIMSAYFIIILLHEIIHFLKFIKEKLENKHYNSILDFPSTPKDQEGGKFFINYLFQIPMVSEIIINQAEKILDINNWKNINNLYGIFTEQKDLSNGNSKIFSIRYCISNEKQKQEKSSIDID